MPAKIFRGGVAYGGGGAASDSSVQAIRCGDDIYTPVEGTVNLPDFTTINDTTASDSTTYSSNKINAEYPISSTTTGINPSITDSADGLVQDLTVYGRTDTVEGELRGIGEDGEVDVVTCGKNLINVPDKTITAVGFIFYYDPFIKNYIKDSGNLTFSFDFSGGKGLAQILLYKDNSSGVWDSGAFNIINGRNTVVINNPGNATYVNFFSNAIGTYSNFQLEKGSTATAYEPYVSTSAAVTTGIALYAVGEVKDELDEKKGVVVKRCEKVVFDGSEDWSEYAQSAIDAYGNHSFFLRFSDVPKARYMASSQLPNQLCNILTIASQDAIYYGGTVNTIGVVGDSGNQSFVQIRQQSCSTVADLKTYLAANPVTVVYELAEPVELPLTSAELTQLRNLRTYNPTTNVTVTDAPTSTVDYLLNTDNGQAVADVQNELQEQIDEKADEADLESALALKVDKAEGKGLSTNDYTNADKSTVDNSPIASATTGINPSITDSADGLIQDIKVYGRSDVSKNLFNKDAEHTAGVTLSVANGETVSNVYFTAYTDYIPCTGNTAYVLSAGSNNNTICAYRQDKTYISGTSNYTEGTTTPLVFTTPAEAAYLRVSLLTDQTNSAQLELGSTPTSYEPYFSGIHGIGEDGEVNIVTCGKNLFDINGNHTIDNNDTNHISIVNDSIVFTNNYYIAARYPIYLSPGTYKISCDLSVTTTAYIDISELLLTFHNLTSGHISKTVEISTAGVYTFVFCGEENNSSGEFRNIQLELGSTATTYGPYVSTTAAITTGIPLYAVGGIKDELDEKRGVIVKRCKKVVFDGSEDESWEKLNGGSAKEYAMTINVPDIKGGGISENGIICDTLPVIPSSYTWGDYDRFLSKQSQVKYIAAGIKTITTLNDWKTYLASNPVTVVYELAEPYEIPLTSAELSALRNLRTYASTTNVTITDDPTVDIGYLLNTANGQAVANAIDNAITGVLNTSY